MLVKSKQGNQYVTKYLERNSFVIRKTDDLPKNTWLDWSENEMVTIAEERGIALEDAFNLVLNQYSNPDRKYDFEWHSAFGACQIKGG